MPKGIQTAAEITSTFEEPPPSTARARWRDRFDLAAATPNQWVKVGPFGSSASAGYAKSWARRLASDAGTFETRSHQPRDETAFYVYIRFTPA